MRNRIKIFKGFDRLPDAQLEKLKNFDGLINEYGDYKKELKRNRIITNSAILVLIAFIGAAVFIYYQRERISYKPSEAILPVEPVYGLKTFIGPNPLEVPIIELATLTGRDVQLKMNRAETDEINVKSHHQASLALDSTSKEVITRNSEFVDASPVKGMLHLYTYFNENINYPPGLEKDSIEGVVMVKFSVQLDSSITDISIQQSLGEEFDLEAIRLIRDMPPWKPATQGEITLTRSFVIPVRFSLQNVSSPNKK